MRPKYKKMRLNYKPIRPIYKAMRLMYTMKLNTKQWDQYKK